MRNIKFRGKVLHNNPMVNPADGWVEGFYYQDLVNGEISHFIRSSECEWLINPETLGQFTGLKDKHGKEIYEGDIIMTYVIFAYNHEEIREFWRVGEIRFIAGGFNLTNCTNYYTRSMNGKSDIQPNPKSKFDFPAYRTQIIGNIHDNPELLKGGEE